jgi:hypothetical protein
MPEHWPRTEPRKHLPVTPATSVRAHCAEHSRQETNLPATQDQRRTWPTRYLRIMKYLPSRLERHNVFHVVVRRRTDAV